jgi:hypothetical protein
MISAHDDFRRLSMACIGTSIHPLLLVNALTHSTHDIYRNSILCIGHGIAVANAVAITISTSAEAKELVGGQPSCARTDQEEAEKRIFTDGYVCPLPITLVMCISVLTLHTL